MHMTRIGLAGIVILVVSSLAHASNLVVIQSSGGIDRLAAGMKIGYTSRIELGPGQELDLIKQDGTIFRLTGPYEGPIKDHPAMGDGPAEGGSADSLSAISSLLTGNRGLLSTLGSSRSADIPNSPGDRLDPWQPFLKGIGTFCVRSDEPTVLRENTAKRVIATLISPDFEIQRFVWDKDAKALRLGKPAKAIGGRFTLLLDDRSGESELVFAPRNFPNPADELAWMARSGCVEQALRRLQTLLSERNDY